MKLNPKAADRDRISVIQRVVVARETPVRDLYWTVTPKATLVDVGERGELALPPGATVALGGYFNSLFEFQWRHYTRIEDIALRLRLRGTAVLRLWRESDATGRLLLWEGSIRDGATEIDIPAPGLNARGAGRVFFDITATDGAAVLQDAVYISRGLVAEQVGLVLVFCTFNRERDIGACLDRIAADPELVGALAEIVVVNQGRPGLPQPAALGETLRVVEQGNFGGAGGFTRGLIEALDNPRATHVCFIDDDVRIEPESLYRMIAFFGLARADLALGGHMLDGIRPQVLYEAGAVVDRGNWQLRPQRAGLDLRQDKSLAELTDFTPMDYNGWWLFGFPLAFARRVGLPLPCFIRGDDVEYGLRLNAAGLTTVGLPGVAVWHEPFYVKIGGWQLYYEVRNQLVAASLHLGLTPRHAAILTTKHFLVHLLTFRYFSAALILRGVSDFLRGPELLRGEPGPLHAQFARLRARFPDGHVPRTRVLMPGTIAPSPRTRLGFHVAMLRILARNLLRRTRPDAASCRVDVGDLVWFRQEHAERIVVDDYWSAEMPEFARSREHCRALCEEAVRVIGALWRRGARAASEWRAAVPDLTDDASWRLYLGVEDMTPAPLRVSQPAE